MKNSLILLFSLSISITNAQVSVHTRDTINISVLITPSGFHSRTNGVIDSTNVALGDKANNAAPNIEFSRYNNTMVGHNALKGNIIGNENVGIGHNALTSVANGHNSTAIGNSALRRNNDGLYCTAIGYQALISSYKNGHTAFGANASYTNKSSNTENTTAMGSFALYKNDFSAANNTGIGSKVSYNNTYAHDNTVIGALAAYGSPDISGAGFNTVIGSGVLRIYNNANFNVLAGTSILDSVNTVGYSTVFGANAMKLKLIIAYNVAVGHEAFYRGNAGRNSVAIGASALYQNTSGEDNVAIGTETLRNDIGTRGNTAIGYRSLYAQSSAISYIGYNTAVGVETLTSLTVGVENSALGALSMFNNTTGSYNTAIGNLTLKSNTTGSRNIAIGFRTLISNTNGGYNAAIGIGALLNNTTGSNNTACGINALRNNIGGLVQLAIGDSALSNYSASGFYNVAIGKSAGYSLINGSNNTFLGTLANTTGDFTNATAIGANTLVNANNKIRIGDANVTVIEGQVPFSSVSDRRLKDNIVYTRRLGVDFIMRLKSASYRYISDKTNMRHDGFIAQDIEQIMKDLNLPFSGLKKSDDGMYSLAYSDFIIPLINAKQEQQKKIEKLQKMIVELEKQNDALEALTAPH